MSTRLGLARLETTKYVQNMIEKFSLNDEDLISIAGSVFRDSIITSLAIDPPEEGEEEKFVNMMFQELLDHTIYAIRSLN